ncbi:MAG: dehydrogenase, partial [Myxococcota bacterium]
VVVGGGVVGCLIAWLCGRIAATEVALVDIDPRRAPVAAALGVGFAAPEHAPGDADVVFHASATQAGLRTALGCAGREARVVEASWFGTTEVSLALGGAFFHRRVQLVASQVGTVSPSRSARFDFRRRLEVALALLGDPALDVLVDGESAFDDLPRALPEVVRGVGGGLCHRVRYP